MNGNIRMPNAAEVRDRAKGALWGLVVGDCLGDVLQFGPPRRKGEFVTEMEAGGPFNTPAGYWTDDAAMAMCIMSAYNACRGKYDLKAIADAFLLWLDRGFMSSLDHAFDVGVSTSRSLALYRRDGTLRNGSENGQGNGSLMRNAPASLIGFANGNRAIPLEISDVTHCSAKVRETVGILDDMILRYIFDRDAGIHPYNGAYCNSETGRFAPRSKVRNSGHCVDTLDSAVWAFRTTDTFERALVEAVNNGNDSDSVGAVTGQIAGAYFGFKAIPERWVHAVKDWKKVDYLIERFLDHVLPATTEVSDAPGEDRYFHPSVTADVIAFRKSAAHKGGLSMLLIRRSRDAKAFPGAFALPGGFMDADDEDIVACAKRELSEETGIEAEHFAYLAPFTHKGRDPRGPVHSHLLVTFVEDAQAKCLKAGDDATEAGWFTIEDTDDGDGMRTVRLVCDELHNVIEFRYGPLAGMDELATPKLEWVVGRLAFDHAEMIAVFIEASRRARA